VADLGGEGEVTAAERVLVEEAAKARIIAQAVGDYILRQETLVRDGKFLDVVVQHSAPFGNLGRLCWSGSAWSARPARWTWWRS